MHDALFADQGRLEDPHLWARAEGSSSTSPALTPTGARTPLRRTSTADFRTGIRAGVATTPTLFLPDGERISGRPDEATWGRLLGALSPAGGSLTTEMKNSSIWRTTSTKRSKSTGLVT